MTNNLFKNSWKLNKPYEIKIINIENSMFEEYCKRKIKKIDDCYDLHI